ncbi:Obg family GTPase [Thermosulfuriphilus sp.]
MVSPGWLPEGGEGGGGRGGCGSAPFPTPAKQAPRFAEPGEAGEEKDLLLELKLIADVGLVGLPNVGKSSLLARLSAARPKIADYPFTTLYPVLGVVSLDEGESFVVADIPGLIEGAHKGVGLGLDFLRHIERTKIILYVLDASRGEEVLEDLEVVRKELASYQSSLLKRPQAVALNKIDLIFERQVLASIIEKLRKEGYPVFLVSAATGEGLKELTSGLYRILKEIKEDREALV